MKKYIGILLCAILFLVGCGDLSDAKTSTVYINGKGEVTSVLVEDFSAEQYQEDELKATIEKEIDSYNKEQAGKAISLSKVAVKDAQARVVMKYDSCSDYQSFNQTTLFSGTVKEAQKAGFDFTNGFLDGSGKEVDASVITDQNSDTKVIITNEPVCVRTDSDILYVSDNVTLDGKKQAQVQSAPSQDNENAGFMINGYAYVIYKNNK